MIDHLHCPIKLEHAFGQNGPSHGWSAAVPSQTSPSRKVRHRWSEKVCSHYIFNEKWRFWGHASMLHGTTFSWLGICSVWKLNRWKIGGVDPGQCKDIQWASLLLGPSRWTQQKSLKTKGVCLNLWAHLTPCRGIEWIHETKWNKIQKIRDFHTIYPQFDRILSASSTSAPSPVDYRKGNIPKPWPSWFWLLSAVNAMLRQPSHLQRAED